MIRSVPTTILFGAISGAIATVAMSGVMLAAQRFGAFGRQPPELITREALRAVDIEPTERELDVAASITHVGFGAALGAAFAVLARSLGAVRSSPEVAGVAFALAVWATSYAGWVPALSIMPPPSRDEPGRPLAMIAAHAVFGAALGAAHRLMPSR